MIKSIFDCTKKEIKNILATLNEDDKKNFLNERKRFGHNSLHKTSSYSKFKLLVENGIDINNTDFDGGPVFYSSLRELNLLLKHGVDVNKLNNNGRNALFYVKTPERAKLLIKFGANINCIDNMGNNPLFSIEESLIPLFLEMGADVKQTNQYGLNVLSFTTGKSLHQLIEYGADIHHVCNKSENILFRYAHLGDYKNLSYLIKTGVNFHQKNTHGNYFFNAHSHRFSKTKLLEELDIPVMLDMQKMDPEDFINYISVTMEKKKIMDNLDKTVSESRVGKQRL